MKVTIPGFVTPIAGARLEINGRVVFLRPRDKYPIFEVGAKELKGIEHLMGPLTVDYPSTKKAAKPKGAPKPSAAAEVPAEASSGSEPAPAAVDEQSVSGDGEADAPSTAETETEKT